MSTHGRCGITRLVFGSVTAMVLHSTQRPLLLVRATKAAQQGPQSPATSKVLVPFDGSSFSFSILPVVEDLALALGASLVMFHALAPVHIQPPSGRDPFRASDLQEGIETQARHLAKVAQEVEEHGLKARSVVSVGSAVDEIVNVAKREEVGLIAMATHGRSGSTNRRAAAISLSH